MAHQLNEPSRSDYYLMRIAAEAFYSNRKHPGSVPLSKFKLGFTTENRPSSARASSPSSQEDIERHQKEVIASLGGHVIRKTRTKEEARALGIMVD